METTLLPENNQPLHLKSAALVAGIGLLLMLPNAPVAELYILPKLIVAENPSQTLRNILENQNLLVWGIFCFLITFICDIFVAWGLYLLLTPVHRAFSLLTAWFRLIYTAIALLALADLYRVYTLTADPNFMELLGADQLAAQVSLAYNGFRDTWAVGYFFFSIHLVLLGYLVYKADYIPKIMGILLIIAGLGYLFSNLRPLLFPNISLDFLMITFIGEIIFMFWLLFRGSRLKR